MVDGGVSKFDFLSSAADMDVLVFFSLNVLPMAKFYSLISLKFTLRLFSVGYHIIYQKKGNISIFLNI